MRLRSIPPVYILVLAAVLRIAWAVAVPVVPVSDGHAYDIFARNLAVGENYGWEPGSPSAVWPVGTSYVYSLVYRVFGYQYVPIVILNVLLGVGIVALTMRLGEQWFGRRVACLAGLILAVWPTHIEFTTILASELLFTFVLLLSIAAWTSTQAPLWRRSLATGIALAAASYLRPVALLLPLVLGLSDVTKGRSSGRTLVGVLGMVFTMVVLIAPWSIRNTRLFGGTVLISTNFGGNLWMGNNPTTTGEYQPPPTLENMNEAEADRTLRKMAVAYIVEHPVEFLWRSLGKLGKLHIRETIGVAWNSEGLKQNYSSGAVFGLKLCGQAYWLLILSLGLAGVAVLWIREGLWSMSTHLVVMIWAYFAAIHAVIVIQDRYHFAFTPMIALLAAVFLTRQWWARPQDVGTEPPVPA